MSVFDRALRLVAVVGFGLVAQQFALRFGSGGLWSGFGAAPAAAAPEARPREDYDLTRLVAVNETLKKISTKYVDPTRVHPQQMFLSALNQVQREVAPVIVLHEEKSPSVKVRVDTEEKEFRVDNVVGPWDVSARLREVFAFLQANLRERDADLRAVEYAACNGILRTLDPHSLFMSPEAYAEMNLSTSGHFGGLGIVISIRDQQLTVIRPMAETPAGRSGLKPYDRITKIDNESTENMPLDDAVARLRGEPGSQVTIWVKREGAEGWKGTRPFELKREQIQIHSVDHRLLAPQIAYAHLKQFQASTSDELEAALNEMASSQPLKGLVLDLRGNPGGLLEQAARVADLFLERGTIVTTVGGSDERQEKRARRTGTQPDYPIVALVNGSSASASEIVVGALKNLDRAVLVGQTTFGKGSVQLVFSNLPDGAALKLTIAQYLTPGGISIQGMGVTPDIELDPMTADSQEMDLFRSQQRLRERDLSKSLSNGAVRRDERPWLTFRYNLPEAERAQLRDPMFDQDEFRLDFPVRFARDLVQRLPRGKRPEQLEGARAFIESEQGREISRVAADLKQLTIDWAPAPTDSAPLAEGHFNVDVTTNRPQNQTGAGESMTLRAQVKNTGTQPIYRLRAVTQSDNLLYDEQELVFGKLEGGQSRAVEVPLGRCEIEGREPGSSKPVPVGAPRVCRLPLDSVTREDVVKLHFEGEGSQPPADAQIRLTTLELPQPNFAYSYQVVDNRPGNGDGRLSRGEGATVYLDVKNIGRGASHETQARLRNLTGNGLLLRDGRFDLSKMEPGATRSVKFTFDVLDVVEGDEIKLELNVVDQDLRVASSEKLKLPLTPSPVTLTPNEARLRVRQAVPLHTEPSSDSSIVGRLQPGSVLNQTAKSDRFARVELGDKRIGFVELSSVQTTQDQPTPVFQPSLTRSPPLLEVVSPQLSTRETSVRIEGTARDNDRLLDVYMFANGRKVFYQSNRKGSDLTQLPFRFEVELSPGVNAITVVARENEDSVASHTLVVRRDGPSGEALPTPKRNLFGDDWEFGESSDDEF
jgi:carboxyl-terminal processing protease